MPQEALGRSWLPAPLPHSRYQPDRPRGRGKVQALRGRQGVGSDSHPEKNRDMS